MAAIHPMDLPDFWDPLYAQEPPWDAGGPAPPIQRVLGDPRSLKVPSKVAFVGVGLGNDAIPCALLGHEVWGFDFAPRAAEITRDRAEIAGIADRLHYEIRDIFTLGAVFPGAFDCVVEYTCYCAIHPSRRPDYVENVAAVLRPGGLLVALFYPDVEDSPGPPFPVRPAEHVTPLFLGDGPFELVHEERPPDSIERRSGKEWLWIGRKK